MKLILAGMISSVTAFIWNRFLIYLKLNEKYRLDFLTPLGEEWIKLSVALSFNIHPLLISAVFGLIEGIYETIHLKKHFTLKTVIAGLGSHSLFGLFYLIQCEVMICFFLAVISHILWNCNILYRRTNSRTGK